MSKIDLGDKSCHPTENEKKSDDLLKIRRKILFRKSVQLRQYINYLFTKKLLVKVEKSNKPYQKRFYFLKYHSI